MFRSFALAIAGLLLAAQVPDTGSPSELLTAGVLRITAGVAAVGVTIAAAGRIALSLSRRL